MSKKEIIDRAVKSFVEGFLSVLIPEITVILNGGFPDVSIAWKIFAPIISAALATGISAVWNTTRGYFDTKN